MLRLCFVVAVAVTGCSANDTSAPALSNPKPAPGKTATAAGTAAAAGALSSDMAAPYFSGDAPEKFALEDWDGAKKAFLGMLGSADAEMKPRIELLIGLCEANLKSWDSAANRFERVAGKLAPIRDYVLYQAARARYFDKDFEKAATLAEQVGADSISGANAVLLRGDVLRAQKKWREVGDLYATYIKERPKGIRRAEARYRLGQALERRSSAATEAIDSYRRVTIEFPLSSWAERSQDRIDDLVRSVSKAEKMRIGTLTGAELIERGMVLYKNMRNEKSEADFAAALATSGLDAEQKCVAAYHHANSVFKQRNRTKAAPLFDKAIKICDKSKNDDLQVKSAYQAGRSYAKIRDRETAIKRYALIEKHHADHTYADDARMRQAEEYRDLNEQQKVTELLSSIPSVYPRGDMRAEAMWRLAWRAYKDKKYTEAIDWLDKQIETMPLDDNYWAEGQAQYWLGRSYGHLGKTAESIKAYESAVRTYPMSYYALLSLNRLRESHTEAFTALEKQIAAVPANYDPNAPAFSFADQPLFHEAGFERALEFLKLGLGTQAAAELYKLGLKSPPKKKRVEDAETIEKLWVMSFLYDAAGRYSQSHWSTRWHILDYKRSWPTGANRARWDIAYPRGWWSILERHANKHGYPPELLIAFVREESAFDPLRESFANAIGLTQMIFSTARRFAKGTGIKVTRAALRDPEKNVTIGSRFLNFLVSKFDRRIALVVPSYNAGEGATGRWLRQRGTWAVDEWSEEIPYDETRNYSKRVIATFFSYSYLSSGAIPAMPNDIPARIIPKKR